MPVQASALLFTKLHRPPVTGDRIDRPRLIEHVESRPARPAEPGQRGGRLRQNHAGQLVDREPDRVAGAGSPRPCHPRRGCRWMKTTATWWFSCATSSPRSARSSPNRAPRLSRCSKRRNRHHRRRSSSRSATRSSVCRRASSWCWMTTMPFAARPCTISSAN